MPYSAADISTAQREMRVMADRVLEAMALRENSAIIAWALEYSKRLRAELKEEDIDLLYWQNLKIWMDGKLPDFLLAKGNVKPNCRSAPAVEGPDCHSGVSPQCEKAEGHAQEPDRE
jgi:hypothetical protein